MVPVDVLHHLAHFLRVAPGRIDAAHQPAHAGAGDVTHRDVVLFQILDHADMSETECATALQNEAELRLVAGRRGVLCNAKDR